MSIPRLIVIGCLAALISGLFGYFVLFEPSGSPTPPAPVDGVSSTTGGAPSSSTTTPAPLPTTSPPTVPATSTTTVPPSTTAVPPPDSRNHPGKPDKKADRG